MERDPQSSNSVSVSVRSLFSQLYSAASCVSRSHRSHAVPFEVSTTAHDQMLERLQPVIINNSFDLVSLKLFMCCHKILDRGCTCIYQVPATPTYTSFEEVQYMITSVQFSVSILECSCKKQRPGNRFWGQLAELNYNIRFIILSMKGLYQIGSEGDDH